jgi:hypothetical protein
MKSLSSQPSPTVPRPVREATETVKDSSITSKPSVPSDQTNSQGSTDLFELSRIAFFSK